MIIHSTRFGDIEVREEKLLHFPNGLPGFQNERKFAFLPNGEYSPFAFLQSATDPDLTFVIVNPFAFFKDYEFTLTDEVLGEIGLSEKMVPDIFNIVRIQGPLESATANLLAPVVINWENHVAMQVVLEKTPYTTRHQLFPNGLPNKPREKGAE